MKELTTRAINDLNNHKQKDLVVDILEIYFVEHVKKVNDLAAVDDYFVNLCKFALENGESVRSYNLMERIVGHTGNKRLDISEQFAMHLAKDGFYTKAYKFYFKSKNEVAIVECMKAVMKQGYESE